MAEKKHLDWCLNHWATEISMECFGTPTCYQQVIMSLDALRAK